jgi:ABC-type multidrug transport system fused ATPase/permease subunit
MVALGLADLALFGIFHSDFVVIEDDNLSFYIKIASSFVMFVAFLLTWYYSNTLIRKRTMKQLSEFGITAIDLDQNKISVADTLRIADDTISKLRLYEDYKFEMFGFALPLFVLVSTTTILVLLKAPAALPFLLLSYGIIGIVIATAVQIVNMCDIKFHSPLFMEFVKNTTAAARGIKLYGAKEFMLEKYKQQSVKSLKLVQKSLTKAIWKAILILCVLFLIACFLYVINGTRNFSLDIVAGTEPLYFVCLFACALLFTSAMRCVRILGIKFEDIATYILRTSNHQRPKKMIGSSNMCIAFTHVSFQDPTQLSDHVLLDDMTFSVMPGECVSITGENASLGLHIFDLLLKYNEPQVGNVYVSGESLKFVNIESLRSRIGLFSENFGLISGTVYENLALANIHQSDIDELAEKIELKETLEENIFDVKGNIRVSQEILLRIQMGRTELQNPGILLIQQPPKFETAESTELFNEYIAYIAPQKTILVITADPKMIIYSDKILYLHDSGYLFGSHAELSKHKAYQRYISTLKLI